MQTSGSDQGWESAGRAQATCTAGAHGTHYTCCHACTL